MLERLQTKGKGTAAHSPLTRTSSVADAIPVAMPLTSR